MGLRKLDSSQSIGHWVLILYAACRLCGSEENTHLHRRVLQLCICWRKIRNTIAWPWFYGTAVEIPQLENESPVDLILLAVHGRSVPDAYMLEPPPSLVPLSARVALNDRKWPVLRRTRYDASYVWWDHFLRVFVSCELVVYGSQELMTPLGSRRYTRNYSSGS